MTTLELVNQAWIKAQGEPFTDGVGSDTWLYLFGLANYYIPVLCTQYGVDWTDTYDPVYEVDTVSATDTFDLDTTEVRKISEERGDFVRITHLDGSYTEYRTVPANQLKNYDPRRSSETVCAKLGATLKFSRPFKSTDPQYGGTITAPIYGYYDLLTDENSDVPGSNPAWFVCMVAYDVALHDILRKDTANNLLAEANDIFKSMKSDNNAAQSSEMSGFDMGFIGGCD
jgi:hypothetical protein